MATTAKTVYGHITRNPRVCGGAPCLDNTRIRVIDIVELAREGKKPEEMLHVFPVRLSLFQVYSALAYADEFPQEIAAAFDEEAEAETEIARDRAQYLKRP